MAIIDLASLCSPIHTFKRGLIFGQNQNLSTKDQGFEAVNPSQNRVHSNSNSSSEFESEITNYGAISVTSLKSKKDYSILGKGIESNLKSNSGSIEVTGSELGVGKVLGTSTSLGLVSGLGQKSESSSNHEPKKTETKIGCHLKSSQETAVLVKQVPSNQTQGGSFNLMKITQNIQNYGYRYTYDNPNMFTNHNNLSLNSYQKNTIAIFDLDDTLIPTDWIRDTYTKIRQNPALSYLFSNSSNNVYQYIRMQIDQQVNYQLIPIIIRILSHAKNIFLDVAIVTNARSTGWLKVIDTMFPELSNALYELGIPIIRTNPVGKEPDIEDGEKYFNYWMLAKKFEFEKIVVRWSSNIDNGKLDLISIGDNDFEECAAVHLAVVDKAVRYSKIIRCSSGLSPKAFINQLQAISNAIEIERKRSSSHSWINYSNTVSSIIIESGQPFNSETMNLFDDYSTEDE
ncbi:membrane associated with a signal peptide [Cryptosporidium sp. chipmunk genotype I]|uniref:membrane associated with a signal peptide n=1 Tax=Cryptosporidium sp. chipmunk genotype I TaxID=1280935 RepID=UPI00351A66C5|nr:membrane associated with a signal peptide [Cryptosporidium sp. chipmunk genotype I]